MAQDHAHKYLRIKLGKGDYTVYKCMLPGCNHYIRTELVIGNLAKCWRCGNTFQMNQISMTMKKPHCGADTCIRNYRRNTGGAAA